MDEVDFYLIDLKSRFDKIKPNTYYLSYSGGKDSHFLYWFIKDYLKREDIKIVGINTYMEHPEIRNRILLIIVEFFQKGLSRKNCHHDVICFRLIAV